MQQRAAAKLDSQNKDILFAKTLDIGDIGISKVVSQRPYAFYCVRTLGAERAGN